MKTPRSYFTIILMLVMMTGVAVLGQDKSTPAPSGQGAAAPGEQMLPRLRRITPPRAGHAGEDCSRDPDAGDPGKARRPGVRPAGAGAVGHR